MKPPTRIASRLATCQRLQCTHPASTIRPATRCCEIHTTPAKPATVSPIHGTGPPPGRPVPTADSARVWRERRGKQAELLEKAREIRQKSQQHSLQSPQSSSSSSASVRSAENREALARKRFWKDVHVREIDGAWEVHLDSRPLRRLDTKQVVRLPLSKPLLASAIALEWDLLASAQHATRQHLIPLTSLVCRALDIADEDAAGGPSADGTAGGSVREGMARMLMRYLDTDSLLCWAPPPREHDLPPDAGGESLRDVQKRAAEEVVGFLTSRVWPGIEIGPVLDEESIVPRSHPEITRQVIRGWIMGLNAWELAGLERGVLAGKGLLGAARLLVEWSEGFAGFAGANAREETSRSQRFGVEEAARLASIEVDWQTRNWGEVEDTHDVEKEDLRRQLGSVILLVSGTGRK